MPLRRGNITGSKVIFQNMEKKKDVEILVLSDIHLGTRGCHAK
jgi:hypothetical protein